MDQDALRTRNRAAIGGAIMLTAAEQELRLQSIGASEIAAICNLDPYKTAYEVWAEKTGRLEPWAGNDATDAGNRLESVVLDWFEDRESLALQRNVRLLIGGTRLAATCDAITLRDNIPVEAKTSGITGPLPTDWGEAGTDQVPQKYLLQAQVQIAATKAPICHLAALLGSRGFVLFRVERSDHVIEFLKNHAGEWWDRHVAADTPPEMASVPIEVFKRLRREPGKIVSLDEALVSEYQIAKKQRKRAEEREEEYYRQILADLGDAEAGDYGDEKQLLTFFEQSRINVSAKELEKAYPEIFQRFSTESRFRVLRVSKRKGQ